MNVVSHRLFATQRAVRQLERDGALVSSISLGLTTTPEITLEAPVPHQYRQSAVATFSRYADGSTRRVQTCSLHGCQLVWQE